MCSIGKGDEVFRQGVRARDELMRSRFRIQSGGVGFASDVMVPKTPFDCQTNPVHPSFPPGSPQTPFPSFHSRPLRPVSSTPRPSRMRQQTPRHSIGSLDNAISRTDTCRWMAAQQPVEASLPRQGPDANQTPPTYGSRPRYTHSSPQNHLSCGCPPGKSIHPSTPGISRLRPATIRLVHPKRHAINLMAWPIQLIWQQTTPCRNGMHVSH